jgi:putative transposase
VENLGGISGESSKCRHHVETNQWSFRQLEEFIVYKSALAGVPVVFVDPAYTSQTCSKCGSRHKPNGKVFVCPDCGHRDHRDANAAFNIAAKAIGANRLLLSESSFRPADSPVSGNPSLCQV